MGGKGESLTQHRAACAACLLGGWQQRYLHLAKTSECSERGVQLRLVACRAGAGTGAGGRGGVGLVMVLVLVLVGQGAWCLAHQQATRAAFRHADQQAGCSRASAGAGAAAGLQALR